MTTGEHNTVIGAQTGTAMTTATQNTIIGSQVNIASTAAQCISIGWGSNVSGTASFAIGTGASAADSGMAIGASAIAQATSVAIGTSAIANVNDVCIGTSATNQSSGGQNTIIGLSATSFGTLGNNIIIGANSIAIDAATVIGPGLTVQSANVIAISASNIGATGLPVDSAANQLIFGDPRADAFIANVFIGQGANPVASPQASVTLQLTPASGSDVAGSDFIVAPGNGTGTGGSGSIQFQTAPVDLTGSTANALSTVVSISNKGSINSESPQETNPGSTSGDATFTMPFQGGSYKKVIIYLNNLVGTSTYIFPTAFAITPVILTTNGLAAAIATSISTTGVTVTGTTTTGILILEGV